MSELIEKYFVGHSDIPINTEEEDKLFAKEQIFAFKEFLITCKTPMTISLQGEWGSGKTSFYNRIKNELEKENREVFEFVTFDVWEYAQFNMGDKLPIILLSFLQKEIDKKNKVIKNTLSKIINISANVITQKIYKKAIGFEEFFNINVIDQIKNLKSNFQKAVKKRLDNNEAKKIIIFIDNLDRINPEKAIELIEILKTFLDCNQCIFILAIDYDVILKGADKKYGEDKGKVFLDKIIQLPFNMPVETYAIEKYFNYKMNEGFSSDFLKDYRDEMHDILSLTIGTNPRAINRIINAFMVINEVDRYIVKHAEEETEENLDVKILLFFLLCIQHVSKSLYNYYIFNAKVIENNSSLDDYLKICKDKNKIKEYVDESEIKKLNMEVITDKYCNVMERIGKALSTDIIFAIFSRSHFTGGKINIRQK